MNELIFCCGYLIWSFIRQKKLTFTYKWLHRSNCTFFSFWFQLMFFPDFYSYFFFFFFFFAWHEPSAFWVRKYSWKFMNQPSVMSIYREIKKHSWHGLILNWKLEAYNRIWETWWKLAYAPNVVLFQVQ